MWSSPILKQTAYHTAWPFLFFLTQTGVDKSPLPLKRLHFWHCRQFSGSRENHSDLRTHPLFSGDTRIFQCLPAHPRRIASHPHLARLHERCAMCRSFPLIQSATGSSRRGTVETLEGENLANWRFSRRKSSTFVEPQTTNLQRLAAFRSAYACYSHALRSGKPLISLVSCQTPRKTTIRPPYLHVTLIKILWGWKLWEKRSLVGGPWSL